MGEDEQRVSPSNGSVDKLDEILSAIRAGHFRFSSDALTKGDPSLARASSIFAVYLHSLGDPHLLGGQGSKSAIAYGARYYPDNARARLDCEMAALRTVGSRLGEEGLNWWMSEVSEMDSSVPRADRITGGWLPGFQLIPIISGWASEHPDLVLDWYENYGPVAWTDVFQVDRNVPYALCESLVESKGLDGAASWIENEVHDGDIKSRLEGQLLSDMWDVSPTDALAWLNRLPARADKRGLVARVVNRMQDQSSGLGDWLLQEQKSESRDIMIRGLSRNWSNKDSVGLARWAVSSGSVQALADVNDRAWLESLSAELKSASPDLASEWMSNLEGRN